MKNTAKIKNWAVITTNISPYTAPECVSSYLTGTIIEHYDDKIISGKDILTSKLININIDNRRAETQNTVYELIGEPAEEYAEFLKQREEG